MGSYAVVIIREGPRYSGHMDLPEDNDVVQTFPANGPNQSFMGANGASSGRCFAPAFGFVSSQGAHGTPVDDHFPAAS
jgi:hypothetical protein